MITHKIVETMVGNLMDKFEWARVIVAKELFGGKLPDRIYTRGESVLVFEVKPENSKDAEIDKGIGQSSWFLPYGVKPYLVLHQTQAERYGKAFAQLPYLGVLQYSSQGELSQIKKSESDNLPPPTHLQSHRLTRQFLWNFLKRTYKEDGLYSLEAIEETLRLAYPLATFYRQTIARQMLAMGYGRERYNPETMLRHEFKAGAKSYFHILVNRNLTKAGF